MKKSIIKCPECKKVQDKVRVYSECYQYGTVINGKIDDYESVEEITETIAIKCDYCDYDFYSEDSAGLKW